MKYKKKPIVIEAFKWTGDCDQLEDPEWIIDKIKSSEVIFQTSGTSKVTMEIKTLEGWHTASLGDFIIRGVKGEIYPCKPDIFELTYELTESKEETI